MSKIKNDLLLLKEEIANINLKDIGNLHKHSVIEDAFLNPFPYGSFFISDFFCELSLGKTFLLDMTFNQVAVVGDARLCHEQVPPLLSFRKAPKVLLSTIKLYQKTGFH